MYRTDRQIEKGLTCNSGRFNLVAFLGRLGLSLLLLLYCTVADAQVVGDHTLPLKYSIHTYSIVMGNSANTVLWNVYDSTATRERIDAGIDLPYSKTTDYLVNEQGKSAGSAYIILEFTGNLEIGKKYRLAYREESEDDCYIYEFLDFVLQTPIDVDIEAVVERCPDSHLQYLEGVGSPVTQTVLEYHVVLRNTSYNPPGSWYFNYQIIVTGQSGASATIESVDYPGFTFTQPPLQSSNGNAATIDMDLRDVQFDVTINDVPGVRQRIDFRLDQIEGAYSERDIDVIVPLAGQNEIFHYLNAIPAASYIAALD